MGLGSSGAEIAGSACLSASYAFLCLEALLVLVEPSSISTFMHYAGAVCTLWLSFMRVSISWYMLPFVYVVF